MKKKAALILVPTLAMTLMLGTVLVMTVPAIVASGPGDGPTNNDLAPARDCTYFTFSSCPDSCARECIPSDCDINIGCSMDCDAPGSCFDLTRPGWGGDD